MFRVLVMLGVALGSCLTLAPEAPAQVTLEHKIAEGTSYTVDTTTKLEQKLTLAGQDVDTSSETRSVTKNTVGKRDIEGKLRVAEQVESLQITTSVMGQTYQFDSAKPDEKGGSPLEVVRPVHQALAKRTTTTVYDKENRAIAVESSEDTLGNLPAEIEGLVKSQIDPENLKNAANEALDQIKHDPIKPGDTWQRSIYQNLGAGQVMTFGTEYTYAGTIEKDGRTLDKIAVKVTKIDFGLENSPLPFSLKSSDLKAAESDGVILFDRQRGQIVDSTSSTRITGELVFKINDNDLPARLDLKIQSTMLVK